jgi:hypothetical protein
MVPLCILLFGQNAEENGKHAARWNERHAQQLSDPTINLKESELEITANSPRPLDSIVAALAKRNGWHINYEDPVYGDEDIVDDTAPSWLEKHTDGPRAWGVAEARFTRRFKSRASCLTGQSRYFQL